MVAGAEFSPRWHRGPLKQKEAELILLLQEVALGAGGTEWQSTAMGCSLLILNSCAHSCLPALTLGRDTPAKSETAASTQGYSPALAVGRDTPAKSETAVSTRAYSPPLRANFTAECLGQEPAVPAATTVFKPLNCL